MRNSFLRRVGQRQAVCRTCQYSALVGWVQEWVGIHFCSVNRLFGRIPQRSREQRPLHPPSEDGRGCVDTIPYSRNAPFKPWSCTGIFTQFHKSHDCAGVIPVEIKENQGTARCSAPLQFNCATNRGFV